MRFVLGILLGVIITVIVIAVGGYAAVTYGAIGWKADEPPGDFETWAARTSLRASLKPFREEKSPVPDTEENIMAGAKLYTSNCAFCHGTPSMGESKVGAALYQGAPQFGLNDTVSDDPVGKIHAIIYHGIRLTGMPGYSKVMSDNDTWKLALFLKAKDSLPSNVKQFWQTAKQEPLPEHGTTAGGAPGQAGAKPTPENPSTVQGAGPAPNKEQIRHKDADKDRDGD